MNHGIFGRLSGLFTLALCGVMLLLGATTAQAQSLVARIDALEASVAALISQNADQQLQIDGLIADLAAEQTARIAADDTLTANLAAEAATRIAADDTLTANLAAEAATRIAADGTLTANLVAEATARANGDAATLTAAQAYADNLLAGLGLAALTARLDALESKTQFMSVNGTDTIFQGTNLMVQNGLGATESNNALGNIVVGYNEVTGFYGDERAGSHNIIVGKHHDYLSYGNIVGGLANSARSTGGFIAGVFNTVQGSYASILGGTHNFASSSRTAISGGWRNETLGFASTISGGILNTTLGSYSSILGGGSNTTTAAAGESVVTGGYNNKAQHYGSVISGGHSRLTFIDFQWVGGGLHSP